VKINLKMFLVVHKRILLKIDILVQGEQANRWQVTTALKGRHSRKQETDPPLRRIIKVYC